MGPGELIVHGFGDIIDRAHVQTLDDVILLISRGDHQDRNFTQGGIRFEPPASLEAVDARHHDTEQDHQFYFEVTAEKHGHRHIAKGPDREQAVVNLARLIGYPLDE